MRNLFKKTLLRSGLEDNIKFCNISLPKFNPTDFNTNNINDNYIKGITTEQLILSVIYSKLGQKYIKKYPCLILFKSNIFISR